jgi:hypothetical protein
MRAKEFKVGDWVTVKGEADTLCKVWSSIAGGAFIVPLKRPSSEGWYAGVADLTDRNALKNGSSVNRPENPAVESLPSTMKRTRLLLYKSAR